MTQAWKEAVKEPRIGPVIGLMSARLLAAGFLALVVGGLAALSLSTRTRLQAWPPGSGVRRDTTTP